MEKNFVLENITFFDKREGEVVTTEELPVTENGEYTADAGKAYSKVTVNVDSGVPVFVPTVEGTIADPDQDHPVVTNLSELNALGDIAIFSPSENDMTASWSFDSYGSGTGAFIIKKVNNDWAPVSSGGFYTVNATNGEISTYL